MLHFMRPDGMDTVSPAHVQQSLMKKYQGDYKYYWIILLASNSHKQFLRFVIVLQPVLVMLYDPC